MRTTGPATARPMRRTAGTGCSRGSSRTGSRRRAAPSARVQFATSSAFKENARRALGDAGLQKALARSGPSFVARRTAAVAALPEFEQLRDTARDIKNHTLAHLDFYLEEWEANVIAAGGKVHW